MRLTLRRTVFNSTPEIRPLRGLHSSGRACRTNSLHLEARSFDLCRLFGHKNRRKDTAWVSPRTRDGCYRWGVAALSNDYGVIDRYLINIGPECFCVPHVRPQSYARMVFITTCVTDDKRTEGGALPTSDNSAWPFLADATCNLSGDVSAKRWCWRCGGWIAPSVSVPTRSRVTGARRMPPFGGNCPYQCCEVTPMLSNLSASDARA